jgi:hypothetical protein
MRLPEGSGWILFGLGILTALMLAHRLKARRSRRGTDLPERGEERAEARDSADAQLVRLEEFRRDTLARLDTKIRVLNEMIARADATIARLDAAAGREGGVVRAKPGNPLHERVWRLADEGRSVEEIGEATGLRRGEVELVLGLRGARP